MSDLYGTNANAIAEGNMRLQAVRDLNERISQHNTDIANSIQSLREGAKTSETIQAVKDQGVALWAGSKMPDKIKAYNDWKAARNATNPTVSSVKNQISSVVNQKVKSVVPQQISGPAPAAVEEGGLARSATQAASEASEDISNSLGSSLAGRGAASSTLSEGASLLTKEAGAGAEAVAETAGKAALGKVAGAAGGLFGAAQGGMDIYEDIKDSVSSGHLTIAGNNNWEKAGNLLQIGGSIADVVGMAFPPAALLGGVLDLASGATDAIGEKLDADQKSSELTQEQQQETEQEVAAPVLQTVATGRTQ